jgi:hypothetical protein
MLQHYMSNLWSAAVGTAITANLGMNACFRSGGDVISGGAQGDTQDRSCHHWEVGLGVNSRRRYLCLKGKVL